MGKTTSAGGVVLNKKGEVLVVNQNNTSWSLPKGRVDEGEDLLSTAKREIYEESGISELKYVKELGKYQRYKISLDGGDDKSCFKTIHMFLFETNQEKLNPIDPSNPEARWVPKEEVAEILTHKKDKEFFLKVIYKIKLKRVKFLINKQLDKDICKSFLGYEVAGMKFGEDIFRVHPKLGRDPSKKQISDYFDAYYTKNQTKIKKKLEATESDWREIEDDFFELTKKTFQRRRIPSRYTAVITILPFCPRWISKKQFCFTLMDDAKTIRLIIIHEILHMFFYEYVSKHFPGQMSRNQKWHFSEIFNQVVMNNTEFQKFYNPSKQYVYPEHRKHIKEYEKLHRESKSLKEFVKMSIKLTKSSF